MVRRRLLGVILFCLGAGMLLVMAMPAGIFLLAVILTSSGFYLLTCRRR